MGTPLFADLYTVEGENLSGQPWQVYPRPQLRRAEDSWLNLNGAWEFAVSRSEEEPSVYEEIIRVPFPPESLLSGIHRTIPKGAYLWYRREFACPAGFSDGRVLLHIGGADQVAAIWVNGVWLGEHVGGYDSFSYEIAHLLQEKNQVVIRVNDLPRKNVLPYGKQREKRRKQKLEQQLPGCSGGCEGCSGCG